MNGRNSKAKLKWGGGSYVALPRNVLKSHGYANLSAYAVKLLNDLLSQYHGNNNGDLCAALKLMKVRGWKSNSTLSKARKELVEKGFIAVSKMGGRNNPTLFSVTFYSIDECINNKTKFSRHEVMPTTKPANNWAHLEPEGKQSFDLKSAQQKQKTIAAKGNVLHLEKHLKDNPGDKHFKQMAGIEFWKAKQN